MKVLDHRVRERSLTMAEDNSDHEENAESLLKKLIELRRGIIGEATMFPSVGDKMLEKIEAIQRAIVAIEQALEHEKRLRPSVYEKRGLLGT
jgi:hypothetical protein